MLIIIQYREMETKPEMINNIVVSQSLPKTKKVNKQPIQIIEDDDTCEVKNITNTVTKTKYELFWDTHGDGKPSQTERYEKHNSPEWILKFIRIGGGPKMGTTLENYARFEFSCLQKRDKGKNTGYDHKIMVPSKEIYIEQKSSGHWGENDYKWQHVEEKHKWHILLLCGIDYNEIHFWVMNRSVFVKLIEEKKITNQGNKTGESSEGMWFSYSDVAASLIQIKTNEELLHYINLN
jgi:hypothetical protein